MMVAAFPTEEFSKTRYSGKKSYKHNLYEPDYLYQFFEACETYYNSKNLEIQYFFRKLLKFVNYAQKLCKLYYVNLATIE